MSTSSTAAPQKGARFTAVAFALIASLIAAIFAMASPVKAYATEVPSTTVTSQTSMASSSTSSKNTSVNGISVSSKTTVLEYIQAKGATSSQKKAKTYTLKKSMKLYTSYYNTAGKEVWHYKTYPKGKKFYYSSKDKWYHDSVCWNKVKTPTEKKKVGTVIKGSVKIVKTHSFKVWAKTTAKGSASVTVRAYCKTEYTSAEAYATASASYSAFAEAYAYGSTKTSATLSATSNAKKLALKLQLETKMKAKAAASASGKAAASASAKVNCSDKPIPPPVQEKPVIIDLTEVNDVDVTNTTQVCATVNITGTNLGALTFSARFGSFTTTSTFDVSGQVKKCLTYKAPTEVPSGGTDTITVTVRDNKSGLSASDSTTFKVNETPRPPL